MSKPHKSYSKTIRSKENKAKEGNLLAMFELYENYKFGKNVESPDEAKANRYYDLLLKSLPPEKFKIDNVELYQFRRMRNIDIDFDKRLTVIIGNNGSGKTSIVEAIAKTFSWFNRNLEKEGNAKNLTETDINVKAKDYCEVITKISLGKNTQIETVLTKVPPGSTFTKSSEVYDIKLLGAIYRNLAESDNVVFPLLAYYSVERSDFSLAHSYSEKATGEFSTNRYVSLDDALDGSGKLDKFSQLYIELANLAGGETSSDVRELREHINYIEAFLQEAYEGKTPSDSDPLYNQLNIKKRELDNALKNNYSMKYQKHLSYVNHAIETVVPEVTNLNVDRASGKVKLMVNNFGNKVNITQLSQGQKTLVALVGDLARRLVTLNPNAESPLEGHGVVIIDEIELHLHPKWQQEVLSKLQKVFPNLQFIVTTHSPQVLSHVDPEYSTIIKLETEGDDIVNTVVRDTYGRNTDLIYEGNMGVSSRPEKIKKELDNIFKLIDKRKLSEARGIIKSLEKNIGTDGQLAKAKALIERMELLKK